MREHDGRQQSSMIAPWDECAPVALARHTINRLHLLPFAFGRLGLAAESGPCQTPLASHPLCAILAGDVPPPLAIPLPPAHCPVHCSPSGMLPKLQSVRRDYRQLFYTAPIGEYVSGVIMFKETLYQKATDGTPFVEVLGKQGVMAGIKVDEVGNAGTNGTYVHVLIAVTLGGTYVRLWIGVALGGDKWHILCYRSGWVGQMAHGGKLCRECVWGW